MRSFFIVIATLGAACSERSDSGAPPPNEDGAWLAAGTHDERFDRIARHLRGFDAAMVETGYRYGELYWAGQDHNWAYAKYQVAKIRTAVANGVERRPARGASAAMLEGALLAVETATEARDPALFSERFDALTATCNACHQAEQVAFIRVQPPSQRFAPTGPLVSGAGAP